MTFRGITDYIYGRRNRITRADRPHIFIRKLSLYMAYLQDKVDAVKATIDKNQL